MIYSLDYKKDPDLNQDDRKFGPKAPLLSREEYLEQEFFFKTMRERHLEYATQELLKMVRFEVLSSTKLAMAVDFMATEMLHKGTISTAMARLPHYFSPFQVFVMAEAEKDEGRFDYRTGLEVLENLAKFYAMTEESLPPGVQHVTPQGIFLYQIETISRNRLNYRQGLTSMVDDPIFEDDFREWILIVRRQLGCVDLAELIYVRSEYYIRQGGDPAGKKMLFGMKEGQIALANRKKDMNFLFSALQRQLNYPKVPRTIIEDSDAVKIIRLEHRLELLDTRIRLLEEEHQGGINLNSFYKKEQ